MDDPAELRITELPTLRRPVLIAAFRGWNDGGQAATLAAGTLTRIWDARRFNFEACNAIFDVFRLN